MTRKKLLYNAGLAVLIILMTQAFCYALPKFSKEDIPANLPPQIRSQIERLFSQDAAERADGAMKLGEFGAEARPAIPYLIGILSDSYPVVLRVDSKTSDLHFSLERSAWGVAEDREACCRSPDRGARG